MRREAISASVKIFVACSLALWRLIDLNKKKEFPLTSIPFGLVMRGPPTWAITAKCLFLALQSRACAVLYRLYFSQHGSSIQTLIDHTIEYRPLRRHLWKLIQATLLYFIEDFPSLRYRINSWYKFIFRTKRIWISYFVWYGNYLFVIQWKNNLTLGVVKEIY